MCAPSPSSSVASAALGRGTGFIEDYNYPSTGKGMRKKPGCHMRRKHIREKMAPLPENFWPLCPKISLLFSLR